MTATLLDMISAGFPLLEKPSGEYENMKVSGMKFNVRHFEAEGLGHVSVMKATGFMGLMIMDTLIITPTDRDMPLLSYDRVLAMGKDTMLLELYDTLLDKVDLSALDSVKSSAAELPDHDPGSHWYDSLLLPQSIFKKGKKAQSAAFDGLVKDAFAQYLAIAQAAPTCQSEAKLEKTSAYVEGLLSNGGPSTNIFKKNIGEDKTAAFFRTVLFATLP